MLKRCLITLCIIATSFFSTLSHAEATSYPAHPRLIASASDWQHLAQQRKTDAELDRYIGLLLDKARADLDKAPVERKLTGRRLLSVSREFIRRNLLWAFAYRVTGDAIFAERARREMLAVAAFPDWNPSHYLDVAEMTTGMALGYDWLYDAIPEKERAIFRQAIVKNGIAQARNGHKTFSAQNNWGQVCIGGMVLGALAIAEDEPALAQDLLAAARKSVFIAPEAYQPDGIYPEGPGYWNYGTSYQVLLIAALRSALGNDWGLMDAPGLKQSAAFYAQAIGPTGKHFNFADGGEGQELSSAIFYLARELKQATLVNAKLAMIGKNEGLNERFSPLIALWWPSKQSGSTPPLAFNGQGDQPLAIWRSAWNDANATYFAIKAGGAKHNHAHMDAGSFVLDMDGVRWAKDLGSQDYNSLEQRGFTLFNMKQDSERWTVFRLSNDSHNTLTIDKALHNANGMASLRMQDANTAAIDLTPALQGSGLFGTRIQQATRTAHFANSTIQIDDVVLGAPAGTDIRWAMTTDAMISISGSTATLKIKNKTLQVHFSGTPVTLEARDISAPRSDFDFPNKNTRQLIAHAPADAKGEWRLQVRFTRDQ